MPLPVFMDVHVPAGVTEGQRQNLSFHGVLFVPQGTPIGRMIEDAELCLAGMTVDEFHNRVVHLPLQ
jgi:hypothetical protein